MFVWVKFTNRSPGTVEGDSLEDVRTKAAKFGEVASVAAIPYPAEPVYLQEDKTPAFCFSPERCSGRGSCPNNPSCTN